MDCGRKSERANEHQKGAALNIERCADVKWDSKQIVPWTGHKMEMTGIRRCFGLEGKFCPYVVRYKNYRSLK